MTHPSPASTMMYLHKRGNLMLLLPDVLREIYLGSRTGVLHISHGDESLSFRVVNGEVVSGSSSAERGRLGETMVRHGLLSASDLERALAVVGETGRRLGPVLRERALVDAVRLEQALALHIREMFLTALLWEEGMLLFEDQELPEAPAEDLTLRCSTGELILELVRRIPGPEMVRKALGDLDRPLVAVKDPPLRLDRITLTPSDGYLLARADGSLSARTVVDLTPLPVEEVERSLLGLLCTGVLEYRTGMVTARPGEAIPQAGPAVAPAPSPPVTEAAAWQSEVRAAFVGLRSRSHFDVLGVRPTAGPTEIDEAYVRAVKRFDPVSHPEAGPELRPKLQAVFARIGEAYRVLNNPENRARYEATLRVDPRRRAAAAASAVTPPPVARAAGGDPRSVPEVLSAAEVLLTEDRCREAVALLECLMPRAKGPLERRARLLLGRAYSMSPDRAQKAEAEFLRIISLDPGDVDGHFALGKLYGQLGQKSRARAMFEKVLQLHPGHKLALAELGKGAGGLLSRLVRRSL